MSEVIQVQIIQVIQVGSNSIIQVCFGFALLKLSDWFKNLVSLSQPNIRRKTKTNHSLQVFASSFDWFTRLSVSFMTGVITLVLVLRHSIENCSYCR